RPVRQRPARALRRGGDGGDEAVLDRRPVHRLLRQEGRPAAGGGAAPGRRPLPAGRDRRLPAGPGAGRAGHVEPQPEPLAGRTGGGLRDPPGPGRRGGARRRRRARRREAPPGGGQRADDRRPRPAGVRRGRGGRHAGPRRGARGRGAGGGGGPGGRRPPHRQPVHPRRRRGGGRRPGSWRRPRPGGPVRRTMMKSKIHRARVTGADLNYVGSISLDPGLMELADILEWEKVAVLDIDNGARFETYAIVGGPGEVTLNGAAARLVHPGDRVIVITYADYED